MKKLLTQYSAYHLWANQLLFDFLLKFPDELHCQEVKSSFPSICKTALHMLDAETIWWQRMKLLEQIFVPSSAFSGGLSDVVTALRKQSLQWHEWILAAQDHQLEHEFIYYNSKKEKFKQATYQVILQVFNHGSYHRGQLVTILRGLEVEGMPQMDFIAWGRKQGVV
ncbi:MAG TPA: DinB family protein [Chitinophagaceae bacterium]|jgi:uncharacterized damage-inducible protein DinB|nr:DinB family protein [Chitinophagaceae bacterium]